MSLQAHHFLISQHFEIRSSLFDIRHSKSPRGISNAEQGISKAEVPSSPLSRPLVKQHHVWLTSRNRRRTSFTGDHTFAAARTEFLRSKWYSTRPRAWNCGFDSRRDAGKPASHSSFAFLRKNHLLRQRGRGYSGNQWVQIPSS